MVKPEKLLPKLIWVSAFAIAMGFLESAVVIYLRELYYPEGFQFPLKVLPPKIGLVELLREAATLIMLAAVAWLCGKKFLERFAFFLISFAIWDLFYYLFLYLFLNWPESWYTFDILFLLPFPWTGPVIAPCLVAAGMLLFGAIILKAGQKNSGLVSISRIQWFFLICGNLLILAAFLNDYFQLLWHNTPGPSATESEGLLLLFRNFVPRDFNWWLFGFGNALTAFGIYQFTKKYLINSRPSNPTTPAT
jgi:hypothetical protein